MKLILVLCAMLCTGISEAQIILDRQVIGSLGMSGTASAYQVSATAGEPMTTTLKSATLVVTQGFQQPDKLASTRVANYSRPNHFKLFPNPVGQVLKLQAEGSSGQAVRISIVNAAGQLINTMPILWTTSSLQPLDINFSLYPAGNYTVTITDDAFTESYKVTKIE